MQGGKTLLDGLDPSGSAFCVEGGQWIFIWNLSLYARFVMFQYQNPIIKLCSQENNYKQLLLLYNRSILWQKNWSVRTALPHFVRQSVSVSTSNDLVLVYVLEKQTATTIAIPVTKTTTLSASNSNAGTYTLQNFNWGPKYLFFEIISLINHNMW